MRVMLLRLLIPVLFVSSLARPIDFDRNNKYSGHSIQHQKRTHHHRKTRASNNDDSNKCYFSTKRFNQLETTERDKYATVSTNCSLDLIRWEELLQKNFFDDTTQGSLHEMDTVAVRGAAEYVNWDDESTVELIKNRKICSRHVKELLTEWKTTFRQDHMLRGMVNHQNSFKCSIPNSVPGHSSGKSRVMQNNRRLEKEEAHAILKSYGVHVHMGIPLCKEHKTEIKILASMQLVRLNSSTNASPYCLRSSHSGTPESMYSLETNNNSDDDTNEQPDRIQVPVEAATTSPSLSDFQKKKFFEFVDSLDVKYAHPRQVNHVHKTENNFFQLFSKLLRRSQLRRVTAFRTIIDAQSEALAPGEANLLLDMTLTNDTDDWAKWNNENFDEIMKSVAQEFETADTIMERRSVLAIAAGSLPYNVVLKYIPNLTYYQYHQAKLYSLRMTRDKKITSPKRIKFDKKKVEDFVIFFTSELFRTDLPFGRRTLKRVDGTKFDIPDVLRTIKHTEIIQLYIKAKTKNGEQNETLSVSTMYKILEACKATQRKSLTCLDYYVQEADDGFDSVKTVIDYFLKNQYIDGLFAKSLNNRFLEVKQYFKGDFKLRLKNISRVGDHCIQHSLSSNETQFSKQCSDGIDTHVHDMFCQRCEMAKQTFAEMIEIVSHKINEARKSKLKPTKKENEVEAEVLEEKMIVVKEAIAAIENLKRHTLRNIHIQRQRLKIIENQKADEAFLTMDWAQKVLPRRFREAQSEYYGKSGISVHVINVLKLDERKSPAHHNLIHIMKQDNQDSGAFLLILEHSLKVLRQAGILSVHLRSDNANCYHSTGTIMSLSEISRKTGVKISSFTFSEPQGGKGAADRAANDAKKKLKDYINSGHDAETPEQLFDALTKGRVPKAMSTYLVSVDPNSINKTSLRTVPSITNFFDFWYNNEKVRMKKYGEIGIGEELITNQYQTISGNMTVLREGGFTVETTDFWNSIKCQTTCEKDEDRESIEIEKEEETTGDDDYEPDPDSIPSVTGKHYFRCPEDSCDRKFLTFNNLQRHIQLGKHHYQPEKEGMLDTATSFYKQRLEHWDTSSRTFFPTMEQEILNSSRTILAIKKGWALPEKKSCQRHSEKAKKFIIETFQKLREQRTKPDFKAISEQMKHVLGDDGKTKKFEITERLNHKQIKNMYLSFGKYAGNLIDAKNRVPPTTSTTSPTTTTKTTSKKRKNNEKDSQEQTKRKSVSRPKRDENLAGLTNEEVEKILREVMRSFDTLECDDSDALFDNFETNEDIVDEVMSEVMKYRDDIFV